uniref:Uncharacterized protein n=1 Tax=Nelumbo nucifera TaxID=4432 RepID=A0A822XNB7_NELNU|nr:TPA_asm: hypothetical protein HUJ06_023220 [Nelumbo nucifera]
MDDRLVTEELLSANFLIPLDENAFNGNSLAELCCDSLRDFNPMVRVSVEKGDSLFYLMLSFNSMVYIFMFSPNFVYILVSLYDLYPKSNLLVEIIRTYFRVVPFVLLSLYYIHTPVLC